MTAQTQALKDILAAEGFAFIPRTLPLRNLEPSAAVFPVYVSGQTRSTMDNHGLGLALQQAGTWADSPLILIDRDDLAGLPKTLDSLNKVLRSKTSFTTDFSSEELPAKPLRELFHFAGERKITSLQIQTATQGLFSVIVLPDLSVSPAKFVSTITHIPEDRMGGGIAARTPAPAFYSALLAHEAGHCAFRHTRAWQRIVKQVTDHNIPVIKPLWDSYRLQEETEADLVSARILSAAIQDGSLPGAAEALTLTLTLRAHLDTRFSPANASVPFFEQWRQAPGTPAGLDTGSAVAALYEIKGKSLRLLFNGPPPQDERSYFLWPDEVHDSLSTLLSNNAFAPGSLAALYAQTHLDAVRTLAPDYVESGTYSAYWEQKRQDYARQRGIL